jgi:hypothetical protein
MSDQGTPGINSAANLARLQKEGQVLSSQELKELNARIKSLKEMARIETCLWALEEQATKGQKCPRLTDNPETLSYIHLTIKLGEPRPEPDSETNSEPNFKPNFEPNFEPNYKPDLEPEPESSSTVGT